MPTEVINFGVLVALTSGAIIAFFKWRERKEITAVAGFALGLLVMYLLVITYSGIRSPFPSATNLTAPTSIPTPTHAPTSMVSSSKSLSELPFTCYGWQVTGPSQSGTYNLVAINNIRSRIPTFKLDYTMPTFNPISWSGIGLHCNLQEPHDLSNFTFMRLRMSFYSKETTCRFEIKDHEEKDNFVFMGLSVSVGSDITISVSGNTQTAVIPLNKYFSSINRKFVKGMGCYSLSEDLQGNHSFTLEDVEFFK